MHKNTYKDIVWIDLENPTQEEVRFLIEKYNIEPFVADELLSPSIRPHADMYENFIYLILHFPVAYSPKENVLIKKIQEIDFIIGKNFIITTRYDEVDALHNFSKVFEVNSILDKSDMGKHAGYVFFYMIQHLYKTIEDKINNVRDLLTDAENKIFLGKEKAMVVELSELHRIILTFKESISTHKEVLVSFETAGEQFFGKEFKYRLLNILGEFYKINNNIDTTKEYLNELRITNDSLLSAKQNEIMKTLTIMAFVTFPLSLIAGIFGMNTKIIPIVGRPFDFWIVLSIMLGLTLIMFTYFKIKKWL